MRRLFVPGLILTTLTVATAIAQTNRPQLVVLTAQADLQAERLWLHGEHFTWANDRGTGMEFVDPVAQTAVYDGWIRYGKRDK